MPEPLQRYIQDLSHRVWILQDQTLIAVPRKERTVPVTVTLLPCKYPDLLEKGRGDPVYLGLKEPNCCLFCTEDGEQPELQLKERNIMELYYQREPVKPFLFYHNKSARTSAFESVAFPGWFIGICSQGGCPLFLTQELGQTFITDFELTAVH
ncbi:interleukin-36 alpha-like [Perognathus longimembris pacificus]|uniref:interleukin-36 alpha-like n=1 Tax=Perognathus longimembris pacificus TaxID=214514 RepID=UPI002018C5F8|nr:interleukin-36 alpha-like [Perognathus longimembris pacificus]